MNDIELGGNTQVNEAIKTLTINGNQKTINGNGTHQFLQINTGQTVTINNITITNCKATIGGAINNNGNLTITDSNLNNNNADMGGAISNFGELTITGSTLNNNNATKGGAILSKNADRTIITGNTFTRNTASDKETLVIQEQQTQ